MAHNFASNSASSPLSLSALSCFPTSGSTCANDDKVRRSLLYNSLSLIQCQPDSLSAKPVRAGRYIMIFFSTMRCLLIQNLSLHEATSEIVHSVFR
jgi:hypothetical protein